MRRGRLMVMFAGAGATLAVILSVGLALGWPGHDTEPSPHRLRVRATTSAGPTPLPAPPHWDSHHQPPPSRSEESFATELALDHPWLGLKVREAYAEVTGERLSSAADLRIRSLIFRRHGCEAHRCLQLFIWLPDRSAIDLGRIIVDLSTEEVRVLKW